MSLIIQKENGEALSEAAENGDLGVTVKCCCFFLCPAMVNPSGYSEWYRQNFSPLQSFVWSCTLGWEMLSDTFVSSVFPREVCCVYQQTSSQGPVNFSQSFQISLSLPPMTVLVFAPSLITISNESSPCQTSAVSLHLEQHPWNLLWAL